MDLENSSSSSSSTSSSSSSAAPDNAKAAALVSKRFEDAETSKAEKRRERNCRYLLISWGLQFVCAILCTVGLIWATIQFMRIFGVLGITSQEPPGLTYLVEFPVSATFSCIDCAARTDFVLAGVAHTGPATTSSSDGGMTTTPLRRGPVILNHAKASRAASNRLAEASAAAVGS